MSRTSNGWSASCPAHGDETPSLSIGAGDDGRVLIHCHAGCSAEQVVAAVGMSMADLGPSENTVASRTEEMAQGRKPASRPANQPITVPIGHLDLLLSPVYDENRLHHPLHRADLRKSGLTDDTIATQKFTDVPPAMLTVLLRFNPVKVGSAYLIPFADPRGGWMPHIRMKVFPAFKGARGQTVKYLQPPSSGIRLYFPVATLPAVLQSGEPLWVIEGEKKSLAVAQLGLPAIGICGIEGWHSAGTRALLEDFDHINLRRTVKIVPDADVRSNPAVAGATNRFAEALERRGARAQIVMLPAEVPA